MKIINYFLFPIPLIFMPAYAEQSTSIYQLESSWIAQSNETITLKKFSGKTVVLAMAYTSCEYACPIIVSLMKRIEVSLTPDELQKVHFVLVSFDPERDTPKALQSYAVKMNLDKERWTLLHGAHDDIQELAILLGIKFKNDNRGGFSHSNVITVLNLGGDIAYQHIGLNQDLEETIKRIKMVLLLKAPFS